MSYHMHHFEHLTIDLDLGLLIGTGGEKVRLSPINLKVLAVLLAQAPELISRRGLFERAWPNQSVSDDTLNRCISDIRSLISSLSPDIKYIETVPKRGYRWTAPRLQQESMPKGDSDAPSRKSKRGVDRSTFFKNALIVGVLAVFITLLSSTFLTAMITPAETRLVLLFNSSTSPDLERGRSSFNTHLRQELGKTLYFSLLASSTIKASPKSPYPYFYLEYGAKWVVEIQLSRLGDEVEVRADIVDARTGIIQASLQERKRWPMQEPRTWQSISYSIHEAIKKLNR